MLCPGLPWAERVLQGGVAGSRQGEAAPHYFQRGGSTLAAR
jgi:hypothetical protein